MSLHPVIASLLVLVALGAVAALAHAVARRGTASPELPRKLIHVGMGLVCLPFPWLFARPLPVQLLAAFAVFLLVLTRTLPSWRASIGRTLHGVSRDSVGDLLFPIAVAILFTFAHLTPVHYLIPLLLLTLADAAGALFGLRFGRVRFHCGDGVKSLEGSLAFLLLGFLCAWLPLVLGTATGLLESTLIALILALLTMMAEAISSRGLDNLVIPVAGLFLLRILLALPAPTLALRLVVLVLLLVLVLTVRSWSSLHGSGLLAAALLGYGCFALGDWRYALPPAGLFLSHLITTHRLAVAAQITHGVDTIASLTASSLPWLLAKAAGLVDPLLALFAFATTFATHLAIMHCRTQLWRGRTSPGVIAGIAKGIVFATLPAMLAGLTRLAPSPFAIGTFALVLATTTAAVTVASLLLVRTRARLAGNPATTQAVDAAVALTASLAVFAVLLCQS